MASLQTYLKYRQLFLTIGKNIEVQKLDIYYGINFLYSKDGHLIKIII